MSFKIEVRRMNAKGHDAFLTIVRAKATDILVKVDEILQNDNLSEKILVNGRPIEIEIRYFARRYELAQHLSQWFSHGGSLAKFEGDKEIWNWLSAAWMRTLIEESGESSSKVLGKEEERWLLTSDVLRYHRHLISGPFFAYQANIANPNNAMCMLATPVVSPGELVERIAGKRSLSIGSVCHLATLLYFDSDTGELRKGHTSSPGNPKAFSYYFSQLDVNVDYLGMDVGILLDLLPGNFDRWKQLAKLELSK